MADWDFGEAAERIATARAQLKLRSRLRALAAGLGVGVPPDLERLYEAGDDLEAFTASLERHIEVGEAVTSANAAYDERGGFFSTIGLWGAHPEEDLDAAADAFGKGDLAGAEARAAAAVDRIEDAERVGQQRAALAGGSIAGVLLVGGSSTWAVRRRRRRRSRAAASDTGTSGDDGERDEIADAVGGQVYEYRGEDASRPVAERAEEQAGDERADDAERDRDPSGSHRVAGDGVDVGQADRGEHVPEPEEDA
jgi:hypothetical protein